MDFFYYLFLYKYKKFVEDINDYDKDFSIDDINKTIEELKKQVINNFYHEHFRDFQHAVLTFCNKSSPEHKAMIRQFVGTKLHLLKPI